MSLFNVHKAALVALGAAAIALMGCESSGSNVSVLQSSNVAIAPGSTYAWAPLSPGEMQNGDPRIDNDIIRQRIRSAVDGGLAAKGYRQVSDPAAAQVVVSYFLGLRDQTDYRVDTTPRNIACGHRGCIGGYGWGMYGAPTDVRSVTYTEGTLMIDLTDKASGSLAWRGTSQRRVDRGDGSQEEINSVVADVLNPLPGVAAPGS